MAVTAGMIRTEQSHLHYGDEEGIAAVGATVPLGRIGEPEDVGDRLRETVRGPGRKARTSNTRSPFG